MWTRIKFVIGVTLVCETCRRMILAWIAQQPDRRSVLTGPRYRK
jgi:hypothetical protein